ncbi:MAG: hypothetical protein KDD66_12160 [Bdellovibrionales bacterium]|nr:hypothetical protein [Bdellovibrionales bacterium]
MEQLRGNLEPKSKTPAAVLYVGAVLLVLAVLLRLAFAKVALGNLSVNADEAVSFLQAKYISEGHFPLLFWTQPYQFPYEAYFMSFLFDYLPWDSFGARIVQISLCLVSVCVFLLTFRYLGSWKTTWPGLLLILFPSAYWLTRQVGLLTPQHSMMALLACLIPLIVGASKRSTAPYYWCLAGGIACGMALSNHLLSLSLAVSAAIVLCLGESFRSAVRNTLWFLPGFLVGLAPYLYAKLLIPGAYHRVSETLPLSQTIGRFWDPAVKDLVTTTLGIKLHIFPDGGERLNLFGYLVVPLAVFFLVLLGFVTVIRIAAFWRRLRVNRWPSFELNDVFLGTTILALALLTLTGMDLRPRYALHIVWCFPFLFAYAYAMLPRVGRAVMGVLCVMLVAVNLYTTSRLIAEWERPDFSAHFVNLFDLTSTYKYLEKKGTNTCYSGWWLAYRVIFDSKEKVICAPPFNDRFAQWPQPYYSKIVQQSKNPPYVFGRYVHRYFRVGYFEKFLLKHRIIADRVKLKPYLAYSNFRHKDVPVSKLVPFDMVAPEANCNASDQELLSDGDLNTVWSSQAEQEQGMSLILTLKAELPVHALRMFTQDKVYEEHPPRVSVSARAVDGEWQVIAENLIGHPYPVQLDKTIEPYLFDYLELTFGFEPVMAKQIKIEVSTPQKGRDWRLAEIQLFTDAATQLSN